MLHLIPAPLHRLVLRLGHKARKRWWKLSPKSRSGVSIIALDKDERVLLVRHSYGSGLWTLPGGGRGSSEDIETCARREMREELGCELEALVLAATFDEELYGARHRASVFTCRFVGEPKVDGREIVELGWFSRADLPEGLSIHAVERLRRAFPDG
jgi:ADP-ribose pyrophosphatase YjhB (NUDIX family)